MSEHQHDWKLPEGGCFVVATSPPQYPYRCECGAFTHDPETGKPCRTCDPEDWERRTDQLATLRGGPLNGASVVRPLNRYVLYREGEPRGGVQKVLRYIRSDDDSNVWDFKWNDWAVPVVRR